MGSARQGHGRFNDIVLQYDGSSSINIFSIKFGEAVCIFAPHPQNEHVKFIDNNKGSFHCSIEPWWVKCVSYHTEKKDIALINENIIRHIVVKIDE